jgi:nucleoside-diphosphate-sugar epimerase
VILVTGGTGFIGTHLVDYLRGRGYPLRVALRRPSHIAGVETIAVGDLAHPVDWGPALRGVHTVVHLAARAHAVRDRGAAAAARYLAVNCEATRLLAEASAASGVRRMIFLSSSKVLGNETVPGQEWTEESKPAPQDAYGRSKLAAEHALWDVARRYPMDMIVLRAPAVYGPGVRANILQLFRLVDRGVPIPLGLVQNYRSFVYVANLAHAIATVLESPQAAGELFHVSDGSPVLMATLARAIGRLIDRPVRLVPVPQPLLRLAGRIGDVAEWLTGVHLPATTQDVRRLAGSLVLNDRKLRMMLEWRPPVTADEGLARTAAWYRTAAGSHVARSAATGER